jgi:hypothetical protein
MTEASAPTASVSKPGMAVVMPLIVKLLPRSRRRWTGAVI